VGRQQLRVSVAADGLEQPRRTFDVREQEGDGAARELLRSFAQVLTPFFIELAEEAILDQVPAGGDRRSDG